jgi:AcrR family transcriptional regulator
MERSNSGVVSGLRERKKRETRERLGDVSARLFAEHGYDEVSIADVARAAGVSEQTVYNYFPTKPDLVFDRADEVLEKIRSAVSGRAPGQSPADAMLAVVLDDIDRYVEEDPALAKGEFPAQCRLSALLRRRALEFYDDVTTAVAAELAGTGPNAVFERAHSAALVSVVQQTTAGIGDAVLSDAHRGDTRERLADAATATLNLLSGRWYRENAD